MASLLDVCLASSDVDKQYQAFLGELAQIENEFIQDIRSVQTSQDSKDANSAADEALTEFKSLFASSPLGSLRNVQKDSGMSPLDRTEDDVVESLADRGYIIANRRLFFCSTDRTTSRKGTVQVTDVDASQGVRDGEFSIEMLKGILPGYEEPNYREVLSNLSPKTRTSSYTGSSSSSVSVDGNLNQLRELLRSHGGDLKKLDKFLENSARSTTFILHSKLEVKILNRPSTVSKDQFDIQYARRTLNYPLFQDDVFVDDDTMYCVVENTAEAFDYDVARVVTCDNLIYVKDNAPVFVTRGFDQSKLGKNSYLLGLVVNGVARVVDVTGDRGIRSYSSSYSSNDVASALRSVFPDLLDASAVGDELFLTTKGSGAYASLEFFHVPEYDAMDAVGISTALKKSHNVDATAKPVLISGGINPIRYTTLQQALNAKTLPVPQFNVVIHDKYGYWNDVSSSIYEHLSYVDTNSDEEVLSSKELELSRVSKANGLCRFSYLDQCNLYDLQNTLKALGNDALRILCYTDVRDIDIYTNHDHVYSELSIDFETLKAQNGFSNNLGKTTTLAPSTLNRTQLNTALLLGQATNENILVGNSDNAIDLNKRFTNSLAVGISSSSLSEMQSSDMSAKGYDSLLSDFIYAINLFRPALVVSTSDVGRSISDYMKREYPEAYSAIAQASAYVESKVNAGEDYASELYEGSVVKQAADVTSRANDDAVNILRRADALLASAEKTMRAYAASYQETYDKIMSLSNIGVNIYTNEGFQTKYLSCYVGGSASLLLGKVLEKYLLKINEMADKLNRMLQKIAKALRKYFDKITCILKNMNLSISGYMSYSTVRTGFLGVQLNMNCIVSAGVGIDPQIATEVTSIFSRILAILNMFELQLVTFEEQDKNTQGLASQAQADLFNTIQDALDRLKACL